MASAPDTKHRGYELRARRWTWPSTQTWSFPGEEWSYEWGGSEAQWFGAILPRIGRYIPAGVILEIAPGWGRWTYFLETECHCLKAVDVSSANIDYCRARFADSSNLEFFVNDGVSLPMIAESSVDFAFSFDSLVHAGEDVIRAYILELVRKLSPDGVAFLHHSNLNGCAPSVMNPHARAPSMSAEKFRSFCNEIGAQCISQEIINWGQPELVDCFSVFTLPTSIWAGDNVVLTNPNFMTEAAWCKTTARLYHRTK